MIIPRRSLLTGGAALAALAATHESAEAANVPFTTFAFKASGSNQVARTEPDRLAEVKNVLDFGADPTGSGDSTTAIQNAVNSLSGANRGIIFFPLGVYKVGGSGSGVTYNYNGNLSIHFLGADGSGSFIEGNFAGFLFDRSNVNSGSPNNTPGGRIFEKLSFSNSNTGGGCVRMGSTIGGAVRDCVFSGYVAFTTEDSAGNSSQSILIENCKFTSPGTSTPQENVIIGGSGAMLNCDFSDGDTAIRAYGSGLFMAGNRGEHVNNHYLMGTDSAGNPQATSGFVIMGGSSEGVTTALDLGGPGGGVCSGFFISAGNDGHDKSNSGYPLNSINSQYGLLIRSGCAINGIFHGCTTTGSLDVAGISIGNASSRANLVFIGCSGFQSGGTGANWVLPTNAYTALFNNCNIQPTWTFSQLPSGGNVLEGDEFNITDGTNSLTWGQTETATGTHTTHRLVRYNGTNWTVVGQ